MWVSGWTERSTDKEPITMWEGVSTREAGRQTRNTGMACRYGQMGIDMRVNGKTNDMGKAHTFIQMEPRERQSMRMVHASDGHQLDLISIS